MYFNGMFNLDDWDEAALYAVFDDWADWDKFYLYKQFLGAQKEFIVTDKYHKKRTVSWGKACILLSNKEPCFADYDWIKLNTIIVEIKTSLFYAVASQFHVTASVLVIAACTIGGICLKWYVLSYVTVKLPTVNAG